MAKPHQSPAAIKQAVASRVKLSNLRQAMARQFGGSPNAYSKLQLLDTIKEKSLPIGVIPVELFNVFPAIERAALLKRRGNGAGMSIPLDAIPAKRERKTNGADAGNAPKKRNAELFAKIIDILAKPDTSDQVAQRLLAVLDRLL